MLLTKCQDYKDKRHMLATNFTTLAYWTSESPLGVQTSPDFDWKITHNPYQSGCDDAKEIEIITITSPIFSFIHICFNFCGR